MKYFKMFLKKLLRYVLKPLSFLPALMMMFVIFNFSAQDGTASSSVSSTVSVRFVQVCDRAWTGDGAMRRSRIMRNGLNIMYASWLM